MCECEETWIESKILDVVCWPAVKVMSSNWYEKRVPTEGTLAFTTHLFIACTLTFVTWILFFAAIGALILLCIN